MTIGNINTYQLLILSARLANKKARCLRVVLGSAAFGFQRTRNNK